VRLVAEAAAGAGTVAIGDQTWARFLVDLQAQLPSAGWRRASSLIGPLRAVKDAAEVEGLRQAGAAVDRIAAELQSGAIPLVGRTEADVSEELSRRIIAEGHERTNFAIVAAGENAASPHHHASERVIAAGEIVLCDFGGTFPLGDSGVGYCSDITRCVHVGEPPAEVAEMYAVLQDAQERAVAAAVVGTPAGDVDGVARSLIADGGFDGLFIHRLGHGIGVEEHEDPYLVAGNDEPLVEGNAFSIEPGIYAAGRWGARIEDIVVATADGPLRLNTADHGLAVVES
jgi:Xaa-Pro aminopeptidase